ncbi:hypothetical protein BCR44DRAFT_1501325 [Catenaria anguillulae PL171]|uniref:Uncharacterized protein n=1 Tax=Catenaria anguillulae PL171 TaxID=765915 RepID=A0A1Y2HFS6_9FUNG|nr:hypothetical protein BCR44DRAFT_1501325 [Catenaria anguillulae PL171]
MTLVFDNGTGLFKAGWASDPDPSLITEPVVTKIREKHAPAPGLYVGPHAGGRIERQRTPFDDGVLVSSDLMEAVLDHAFISLNISRNGFDNVIATEPFAHPSFARGILEELLFEAYEAPAAAVGVDSLFALHHVAPDALMRGQAAAGGKRAVVVVSIGHSSTCIVPVDTSGAPMVTQAQRLGVGWHKLSSYMHHAIQLKYPEFPHYLSNRDYQDLMRKHCYVAQSYPTEALKLLHSPDSDVIVQYAIPTGHQMQITQEKVVLTPDEQVRLATDRTAFIADVVLARAKLDEKVNRQKATNAARKRAETKNRMRVMAALIDEDEDEDGGGGGKGGRRARARAKAKADNTFGDDQADWQVYSDLSKDTPDDIDDDAVASLARLDRVLAEYDPHRLHRVPSAAQHKVLYRLASGPPLARDAPDHERLQRAHQLRINIERVRVPEALFAPNVVGVDEAGIQDLVLHAVRAVMDVDEVSEVQVVCTGGGATLPGLDQRLRGELKRELPAVMGVDVVRTDEPVFDAWRGAASAPVVFTTRQEWMETGRVKGSVFSNDI